MPQPPPDTKAGLGQAPDVSTEAVRAHLQKLLASSVFVRSQRMQRFLSFTVEQTLAGNAEQLKEYLLGVEVFGKKPDFDPRLDSLVRVEARRLRSKLDEYYAGEGKDEQIRFVFRRGAYAPGFLLRGAEQIEAIPLEPSPPRRNRSARLVPIALMVAIVSIGGLWLGNRSSHPAPANFNFLRITDRPGVVSFSAISPDGTAVLYESREAGKTDIYLQRIGGSNAVNLTADSSADSFAPAWSPDGTRIAFRSDRDRGGVFMMGATGESVRRITDFGYHPVFSPDGLEMLVETAPIRGPFSRPARSELWRVKVSNGDKRQLNTFGDAIQSSWSPHGCRISYWSFEGGLRSIVTIPAAGAKTTADLVTVIGDSYLNWNPVWSPDGRWLYFSSDRAGSMNIWRVPIDECSGKVAGAFEQVTTPATDSSQISFSKDGRRMTYTQRNRSANLQSMAFDPVAGAIHGSPAAVTQGPLRTISPALSPDGRWVAFTRTDKQEDLFVAHADGSGVRRLTDDVARDRQPRWSPDGSRIAFYSNRGGKYQIWTIRPDGGEIQQITSVQNGAALYPVWSPDGSRLAYTVQKERNVYLIDPRIPWTAQTPQALPRWENAGDRFEASSWSPQGDKLAGSEVAASGEASGVLVYDLKEAKFRQVTRAGFCPMWLSDGKRVLFSNQDAVWIADTVSGNSREVWSITPHIIESCFSLSRDDKTLLYTRIAEDANIWLMSRQ